MSRSSAELSYSIGPVQNQSLPSASISDALGPSLPLTRTWFSTSRANAASCSA